MTLFIVDLNLQQQLKHKTAYASRFCREVPCDGTQSSIVIAVTQHEDDFCAPAFKDIASGCKSICNGRVMSVPVVDPYNDQLMLTLQVETDLDVASSGQFKSSPTKLKESPQKSRF